MQTLKFINKFETYCDSMGIYMYHCHKLLHEDDGMMRQFVVSCQNTTAVKDISQTNEILILPNPASDKIKVTLAHQEQNFILNCITLGIHACFPLTKLITMK